VALALAPGIGRARLDRLLAAFGTPEGVFQADIEALRDVTDMSRAAASAIRSQSLETAERVLERTAALGGVVLIPGEPAFPSMLRGIPEAPTLLFALGDVDLLSQPCVAIVGSRSHTRYGAEACRFFAGGLARAGLVVVSGMARGLDAVAHTACLDAGRGTVGVLGNGLGVVYPSANRHLYQRVAAEGCLITEFPPGERPNAGSFPRRNRLISGLARCTLVVEAGERSGTLLTVEAALEQGRDVVAVPGPITSPLSVGSNRLIQHGAKPALALRDVLEEYEMSDSAGGGTGPHADDLTEGERGVLRAMSEGAEQADEIAAQLAAPPGEVLAVLTSLEIRGLVRQEPGKLFRRAL
jgi:DNA processing protein